MSALYLRDDFRELVIEAAKFHGIPGPGFIEKDYYVTESLRAIAAVFGNRVIFKGGTSLSKGWSLIERFSEDIDLFVDPEDRGEKARITLLKSVAIAVEAHNGWTASVQKLHSIKGIARATVFEYQSLIAYSTIKNTVIVEVGIQSGAFPTTIRDVRSLLAEFLEDRGFGGISEDLEPFQFTVLHYRRTFVEKLFALHDKVARGVLVDDNPLGKYARHYYDISQLMPDPEVRNMLNTTEYREIAADYFQITSKYFPNQSLPAGMNLHESPALFPDSDLKKKLEVEYQKECKIFCYGNYPSFDDVISSFAEIRKQLQIDLD